LIKEDFNKVFNSNIDIIITPTCCHDTPTYEEYLKNEGVFDEKDFFTACVNIAGVPAISLPANLSDNGLPVGVQFIANTKNDELLLNVANWFSKNNISNFNYLNLYL
jgi:aspartyl-tRNA(Asn)/glutamyl-tRNA(Gln) amidotransferase subunit A